MNIKISLIIIIISISGFFISSYSDLNKKRKVYLKLFSENNEQILDGCIILRLNRMEEFMVEFALTQKFRTYCTNKAGVIAIPEECFSDTAFYTSSDTLFAFFHSGEYPLSDIAITKSNDTLRIIVNE